MNCSFYDLDAENPALFSFEDSFASLHQLETFQKKSIGCVKRSFEQTREFARNHLLPLVLEADLKGQKDREAVDSKILALAVEHHMLSADIPRFMGGSSDGVLWSMGPRIEELAAVDPAYSFGVMAGHGLGMVALSMAMNPEVLDRVTRQVISSEAKGKPFLVDCAITEPMAGTDVEEFELLPHAKLISSARRVSGGVVLNGGKCFISGGHTASLHVVVMPFETGAPSETLSMFLVPANSPGFSLGRVEDKMGMKAGSASELLFKDCFVPEENIVYDESLPAAHRKSIVQAVLGTTRISVGAGGTGIARGAFESAFQYARTRTWKGKAILHQQWAQEILINMLINVYKARAVYLEATAVLCTTLLPAVMPGFTGSGLFKWLFNSKLVKKLRYSQTIREKMFSQYHDNPLEDVQRLQFYSSMAKVVGSDAGMENCHLALELMGADGLCHQSGMEKRFRDVKLFQIFEGTNQLNRLNMFYHYLSRTAPGTPVF